MNTTYFILEQKNPPKKLKPMHLHIAQWLIPVPLDPSRKKWLKTDSYVVFQTVDHARSCCKKQSLYWKNAWTIADEAANRQLKEIDLQPMQKQSTEWLQKGKGNENVQKLWQKTWVRNGEMPSIWQNLYKVFQTKPPSFCLPTNKMGGKLQLEVDNKVTPVVIPPRRVPVAIKVRLKEELDHLESLEVTRREDEPTEWVSSMAVTQKPNGKVRVCLDPKHLNQAWKRRH